MSAPTIAEIDLGNLARNACAIRQAVKPARVICVVKADAYGHGAIPVTRRLLEHGFDFFAVARLTEALALRDAGIGAPILIFGRLCPEEIPAALQNDFRITIFSAEDLDWIEAARPGEPASVHVKIDTGMGRVGVLPEGAPELFTRLAGSRAVTVEGLYSHFATSDEADLSYARGQLSSFRELVAAALQAGLRPPLIHMSNSGGILALPEANFTAVRPGILLYGHYPSSAVARSIPARQVMSLKARVSHLRSLPAGSSVSYGRTFSAPRPSKIAVMAAGYADGVDRRMGNRCRVLISGQTFPIVGRVTMDQIMADVTGSDVKAGDTALLWGEAPGGSISLLEVSEAIGTISYELTCGVGPRVPRVYAG